MKSIKMLQVVALAGCLVIAGSGMAMAAGFNDFASGVKTMTGAAKDVKEMNSDEQKQEPAPKKKAKPAPKKQQTQKPAKQERVRGG